MVNSCFEEISLRCYQRGMKFGLVRGFSCITEHDQSCNCSTRIIVVLEAHL